MLIDEKFHRKEREKGIPLSNSGCLGGLQLKIYILPSIVLSKFSLMGMYNFYVQKKNKIHKLNQKMNLDWSKEWSRIFIAALFIIANIIVMILPWSII